VLILFFLNDFSRLGLVVKMNPASARPSRVRPGASAPLKAAGDGVPSAAAGPAFSFFRGKVHGTAGGGLFWLFRSPYKLF